MLKELIQIAKNNGASDLHLEVGVPPMMRTRGSLAPVGSPISSEFTLRSAKELLVGPLWQEFLERRSCDLSQMICGTRCRINVFQTIRGISLSIRLLTSFQNNRRDCNLHPDLRYNGFKVVDRFGDFKKDRFTSASMKQIYVCK